MKEKTRLGAWPASEEACTGSSEGCSHTGWKDEDPLCFCLFLFRLTCDSQSLFQLMLSD